LDESADIIKLVPILYSPVKQVLKTFSSLSFRVNRKESDSMISIHENKISPILIDTQMVMADSKAFECDLSRIKLNQLLAQGAVN